MGKILVTGATGNVGSEVVRVLAGRGLPVRAAVRNPEGLAGDLPGGVERARLDLTRPETFRPALEGVEALFLMRPPALADTRRYIDPFVDAAEEAGVRRVAFLSLLGAEKPPAAASSGGETPGILPIGLDLPPGELLHAELLHRPPGGDSRARRNFGARRQG